MLADEQLEITQHRSGHALVRAVPGSGKSTAARHLIARHVQEGWTTPREILAVCFNVEAARDFGVALARLVPQDSMPVVINLHALAYRLLRSLFIQGLASKRKLVDDSQEDFWLGMVGLALSRALGIAPGELAQTEVETYYFWIVQAKARRIDLARPPDGWFLSQGIEDPDLFRRVFALYEEERQQAGVMSFDDLIWDLLNLAIADDRIYDRLSDNYGLIIVDEFQDMTRANLDLIRVLAGERASVVAIGDDDQSIYGFRGADPGIMVREFGNFFPKFCSYTLSKTFRYGPLLCRLSNELIAQNSERLVKSAQAFGEQDTEVHLMFCEDETRTVAEIANHVLAGDPSAQIGILLRAYHQSVSSEASLLQADVSYRIEGAEPFFRRPDALALAGYLALASSGDIADDAGLLPIDYATSLARAILLSSNRFLRAADLQQAEAWVASGRPFLAWVRQRCDEAMRSRGSYEQRLGAQLARLLSDTQHLAQLDLDSAGDFVRAFGGYQGFAGDAFWRGVRPAAEREAVYRAIADLADKRDFSVLDLRGFLLRLSQRYAQASRRRGRPQVLITSWHKTKGGEFDAVVLPDLRAGKAPFFCGDSAVDIEEERRLFFVAMTRAKSGLYLLAPEDPELYAEIAGVPRPHTEMSVYRASPFLHDIADWSGVRIWGEAAFLERFAAVS